MPFLTVLTNDQGDVLGTAAAEIPGRGSGLPGQVRVVARPGQQVIRIEVDDNVLNLDPPALHEFIKVNCLRPMPERTDQDPGAAASGQEPGSASEDAGLVRTPAGPMPRDSVHPVAPEEAVTRNPDGTYKVVPRDRGGNGPGQPVPNTISNKGEPKS
jgi:hypothetical protein